ncbi:MAG: heterodisulfide reductase-related iron-sulfur binding cluster [Alphaproteobacteria bacterium]|nr:heterodisulfide reductase-related iron-sulfur binding cluster [Alphaproteobacteria bacterium]
MREGSLEAPTRHIIDWQNPDYYDEARLDAEMRRAFDICHGCRRCFNLCDSFPRLFDLVDEGKTGEVDSVESRDFKDVVDACTLCDLCFMTKCPYVPPHAFDLDFPHLMLRYRAVEARRGNASGIDRELARTDRNGRIANLVAPLANAATSRNSALTRAVLSRVAGFDPRAELPTYAGSPLTRRAQTKAPVVNREAPGFGRKAVLYATCFDNYNDPEVGLAARAVLAQNGVETEVVHPHCCGMPMLEQGHLADVARASAIVAAALTPWIDKGYDVIALVPSCALMLKFEWPLIVPGDGDVARLAQATFDLSEYVVDIAKKHGMAPGMQPLAGGIALHIACHSRAQNMGQKAAEMLKLLPQVRIEVIERCSGHGGAWGFKKGHFDSALKVGRPVAKKVAEGGNVFVTSECPLAGVHILQGVEALGGKGAALRLVKHPIQLLAMSYGLKF